MLQNSTQKNPPLKTDLLIGGGSYVGLSIAIAVKQACPFLNVTLVERAAFNSFQKDPRSFAIAAAAVRMLRQLDCWETIEKDAQPIKKMIITDSKVSQAIRPVFLNFDGDVKENEPFAFMVETKALIGILQKKATALGVHLCYEKSIINFAQDNNNVSAQLDDNTKITAKLLVAADGANSKLRACSGIKTAQWDYNQMGIVCTVRHERPHEGVAIEHFLPAGPFAILPLKNNRSSLVWNEETNYAQKLLKADPFIFEDELERRFGHHLGEISLEGPRFAFPFGLTLARSFIGPRFALAGDAAHRIHPISGQGLNLGFRDSAALSEIIVNTARLGLDIGSITQLEKYQKWRRYETVRMGMTTDILNRLFSNDSSLLRFIRDIGLGLVERTPQLKKYFIQEAAGFSKNTPKLLLGLPL